MNNESKKQMIKLVDEQLVDMWNDFILLVSATEPDIVKNSLGSVRAGVRLRKNLNNLRKKAVAIKKRCFEVDKQRKYKRAEANYNLDKE